MNLIIIGCGYVGSAVASYWRDRSDHRVWATTTTPDRLPELEAIAHRALVLTGTDRDALQQALQDQEGIVLTLAPTSDRQVDADCYEATYLHTAQTLVAALEQTPSVKQIIYTSSCAVYGDRHGDWVTETDPIDPSDRHSEVLFETEQVLLSAAGPTLQVCILRLGALHGPGRELGQRCRRVAGTTRPGTGEFFTNWVHLGDVVAAIDLAIAQRLQGIYNLVNDDPLTLRDLFDRVCRQYNLPPVTWDPSQAKSTPANRRISNQKLKQAGYSLMHPETEL
ncbi:MAG: SDR family oxidoreductase [Elainellaceae cyanobacterium]